MRLLLAALLAAPRGASGLRRVPPEQNESVVEMPLLSAEPKSRQVMYNYLDVQYYTDIRVGGQKITGLLDTGSFELVVFDSACQACGKAGKYSSHASGTFRHGWLEDYLRYGSGSVDVNQAFDTVAVGPYTAVNLSFWQAVDAAMPVLKHARFNSIVGVGPPETPGADSWGVVKEEVDETIDGLEKLRFPSSIVQRGILDDTKKATTQAIQPTLIRANDVTKFSICLGKKPLSDGYFIWNDTSYLEAPSQFDYVKVIGWHTWTVNLTNIGVTVGGHPSTLFSCGNGCGAIVDSGTSLLLMPYDAIYLLRDTLRKMQADCSKPQTLPTMTFLLDGKEFNLPPDAYISRTKKQGQSAVSRGNKTLQGEVVRLDFGGGSCEVAVMASRSKTHWGPLWILGMPFFRRYYTTFEVGKSKEDRGLYVTPASSNCTPAAPGSDFLRGAGYEQQELRELETDDMFIPRIVHRAFTQPFLEL